MSQRQNQMQKEHKENLNLLFYDFNHLPPEEQEELYP